MPQAQETLFAALSSLIEKPFVTAFKKDNAFAQFEMKGIFWNSEDLHKSMKDRIVLLHLATRKIPPSKMYGVHISKWIS